jgi:phosphoribosylformylglycinamidine cyclo-ligase
MFSLDKYKMKDLVLVSSTDGVGTKLKIAFMMDAHNTIGIDLVAMVVNDIIVQGAKPLFFLDYIATGKLEVYTVSEIINGIIFGCRQVDCTLLGGETAELPDFYKKGEYDLSGFAVGVVERDKIIDGSKICPGDKLIGISSSGLHSNGFSLARKICFDVLNLNVDEYIPEFGKGLGQELLTPTKIYVDTVNKINKEFPILGMAHITGGGLIDNVLRVIPESCGIEIKKHNWFVPPIFTFLQQIGNVSEKEMMRVFNNGIGMVLIVHEEIEQDVLEKLNLMGEKSYNLGKVTKRFSAEERAKFV